MTVRHRITGSEPVFSATGDAKNHCAAAISPVSPVSPLVMKHLLKRRSQNKTSTYNTGDTGDVFQSVIVLEVGEAANLRGSTP